MFGIEINTCARCGGELKVIAKILAHLQKTAPDSNQAELPLGARAMPAQQSVGIAAGLRSSVRSEAGNLDLANGAEWGGGGGIQASFSGEPRHGRWFESTIRSRLADLSRLAMK